MRAIVALGEPVTRVVEDTGGVFHPKLIVGAKGEELRALLGSSNLTKGEVRGVKLGTATRLLIAKRPDIFLPVNGANADRIKQVFGTVPKNPSQYMALMKHLWSMPWFKSGEPADEHQRRVWRVRVAILDAVLYERKVGVGPKPFAE